MTESRVEAVRAALLWARDRGLDPHDKRMAQAAIEASDAWLAAQNEPMGAVEEERRLREMMRDPRYCRDKEPEMVNAVSDQFRKWLGEMPCGS